MLVVFRIIGNKYYASMTGILKRYYYSSSITIFNSIATTMNKCLPLLLICLLASCGLCTDLENIQWSENVADAKEKTVFIKRYELVKITGTETVIGEAWLEKQWHYYAKAFTIDEVIDTGYSFCFRIEKYDTTQNNWFAPWGDPNGSWRIQSVNTNDYMNCRRGKHQFYKSIVYVRQLSLVDTTGIDTLSFLLLNRSHVDSTRVYGEEIPYGEMMFRAIE